MQPLPVAMKQLDPHRASSCLIRVVTLDGTRCSLLAARITPPSSMTLLKTLRSATSMGHAPFSF